MWTKNCVIFLAFLVACGAYEVPETVKALGWHTLDFQQLPTPADMTSELSEDDFEDYLNFWLQKKMKLSLKNDIFQEDFQSRAPCTVNVNSLSDPQPVYVSGGTLLAPSDNSGNINFIDRQLVTMACPGTTLFHTPTTSRPREADLICTGGRLFLAPIWLPGTGPVDFSSVNCNSPSVFREDSGISCADRGIVITVGLEVTSQIYTIITSCVDVVKVEVLYVEYDQAYNTKRAPAINPANYKQGNFFSSGLNLQTMYTNVSQKEAFDVILGSGSYDKYVSPYNFLTQGHLAAKADFVFSPAQTATFTFVNVAPQWSMFNAGNWATLEEDLRNRIAAGHAKTKIYTGTFGILQLRDKSSVAFLSNIYLLPTMKAMPVPLWFYKVVYEPLTGRATAFLGLNNPHVTLAEADTYAWEVCPDQCAGNPAFSWLTWQNMNVTLGFSICCNIADFRNTVKERLPAFTANGGLFS